MQHLAKEFRDGASTIFGERRRTRYPAELRSLARRYIGWARGTGESEQDIADALGVTPITLRAWLPIHAKRDAGLGQPGTGRPRLVRVVDCPGNGGVTSDGPRFLVRAPAGLTIECDAEGVAELLRVLA